MKFQKSHLASKFTAAALARPYNGPNSWGQTYGQHKTHLEFTIEQYVQLKAYADEVGILFSASAMDQISLRQLAALPLPFIKIGSGDANNFQLLREAARLVDTPLVISTGMQTTATIRRIVEIMLAAAAAGNGKQNFCLMHCVSAYPTRPEWAGLQTIQLLRKWFPTVCIGYSGHEQESVGISVAAVACGAVVRKIFNFNIILGNLRLLNI